MSRGLIFTRYSTVPIAHIAPAVVAAFVAAQASIAAIFPSHLGSAIDRIARSLVNQALALLLTSHRCQTFNRLSTAITSQAIIYTNKLN